MSKAIGSLGGCVMVYWWLNSAANESPGCTSIPRIRTSTKHSLVIPMRHILKVQNRRWAITIIHQTRTKFHSYISIEFGVTVSLKERRKEV